MEVLVIGAGLAGVTSAWYLAQAGCSVTVVERQPGPGLETSFANGGQISISHPEPWANPGAPLTVLKWLGRSDAPLLFRWPAEPARIIWGLQFLRECLPHRTRRNTLAILISIELILNATDINFAVFNRFLFPGGLEGYFFSLFSIAISAAETAVAIAIMINIYRNIRSIQVNKLDEMKW